MSLPSNLTMEILESALRESLFGMRSIGFCMACGEEHDHVEPDAKNYECNSCGEMEVCGVTYLYMCFAGWG